MHGGLIADLAVVTVVAAITGMVIRRAGQPTILGYLLAGLIVGPYIPIPLFADPHRMEELAEVGVVLVMFAVGLEFRIRRLLDILPVSGLTAGMQVAALSWAGFTVGSLLGWSTAASVCLGATLAISSTMVVSAVLRTRPVDADVRAHVFGILVVQDVVAIVLMAVVTALASGESVGVRALGLLIGQLAGAVVVMLVGGLLLLPRLVRYVSTKFDAEVLVVLVVAAAFGLAWVAHRFGYSVALGAFIAGMAVAESGRGHAVEKAIEPLRSLFSAIFFVSIGMTVDPRVAWESLPLALVLCGVVIGMQFLSVLVSTVLTGSSLRRGIYSALALGQIGELSFILATIAIGGNVMPSETLPALVTVATVTAFTTSLFLGRAQKIVEAIDHLLPERAHEVLAAYQSFMRKSSSAVHEPALRAPMAAVLLDWAALVVLFILRSSIAPFVNGEWSVVADVLAVLVAGPFVVGLIRSARRLSSGISRMARAQQGPTPRAQAVEAIALLAVVLGVGLPTVALVRPLVGGPWVEAVLLCVLLTLSVLLGLRLGSVKGKHTSGVARLALDLRDHVQAGVSGIPSAPPPPPRPEAGPLAGLDYQPLAVPVGGVADGLTLAELDLRCRTGATVVAIRREDRTTTLPTGDELLQAGDILAVSGSAEALERARVILERERPSGELDGAPVG